MKMMGEDVGWRVRVLFVACTLVFLASQALAQDDSMIVSNLTGLAQQVFSANHCLYLPWFTPCRYLGVSTDGGLPFWVDFSQVPCDLLAAATNLNTSPLTQGVPMAAAVLTKTVNTGEVTVQPDGSTNIVAVIAAPDGYEPGICSEDAAIWRAYQALTNCPSCWGIEGDIPPLTVSVRVYVADVGLYGLYQNNVSNIDAQAAAAAAQASSTPTLGSGFTAMDGDDMDDGDPCVITNYSVPFSIVSIAPDGSGDMVLQWQSCTDAVYIVQSESSLTPTSSWTDVAWMFGTDQQTSWTDTNAVGLTQNFYQVVRGNPNTLNNGLIPYGWAVLSGQDPLDPNLATEDPAGDSIDNLQKYEYGLNPQVAYTPDVVVDGGSVWATNQMITLDATGFPFPFLKVSLSPTMTNAVLLANTGVPLTYALPSTSNMLYRLFLQYTDASTNALGPVLYKPVTLDTIPPWVEITSPTNGVGNQAFVHLQATAYDPDPQNPSAPGTFRPVKIWINGQQYWNVSNHQIDIPRFPVLPNTNNVITILAQDQAGNQSQAGVNWYVDTSTATNAPTFTLTGFTPNTVTDLPNEPNVWVSGQMDNLDAIVTATVNGGDPITMIVRSNQFGYLLPLSLGMNTVVISASDAAGNATTNTYTLVPGDRYQFAFTTPAPGTYINNSNVQVIGYVSAVRDAGLPTQTNVVSVTVNGVPTTLTDGGGGLTNFTTIVPLPVPTDGSALVLNAVVTWADGSTDPSAEDEGYTIIAKQTTEDVQWLSAYSPCGPFSYWEEFDQYEYTFSADASDNGTINQSAGDGIDCNGNPYSWGGPSTNVDTDPQPSWVLVFGCTDFQETCLPPSPGHTYSSTDTQDGEITVVPPWSYVEGTWVLASFSGVAYRTTNGAPDLSQVTYQGQAPILWGWIDDQWLGWVSYVVPMSGDTLFTIGSGSFGWPETDYTTTNNAPFDCGPAAQSFSWHTLTVGGFSNAPLPTNIVHVTFATSPSNRGRTTVGVGEQVILYLSPSCPCGNPAWSLSGPGSLTTSGSGMLFTAYDQKSQATVTATCCGKSYSVTFNVREPASESAIITSYDTYPAGTQGVGMHLLITIAPTSVSFYNVQAREVGGPATSITGYFTNVSPSQLYHNPGTNWIPINPPNIWGDHAKLDGCSAPWSAGGFQWVIPVQWHVPIWDTHIGALPNRLQTFSISDTNGTTTVTKLGQSATRTP